MKLVWEFISINLKGQMQYKISFVLTTLGQFITAFTSFFGLFFIFDNFEAIDNFSMEEVFLCFAVVTMAFSIGEMFGSGFLSFSRMLSNGEFDRALVRPRGTIMQIILPNIDFTRLGLFFQASIILVYAILANKAVWTFSKLGILFLMILSGANIFLGLFLLQAALAFFTIENLEFFNIFTYGARQFGRYPFSVYGTKVLWFLTFIIPLALFQYYPLLYLLNKEVNPCFVMLPISALLFLIPCFALFRYGIHKYKSTGS